jgi:hypothetical protein
MELKDLVAISGIGGIHYVTGRSKNGLIVETIGTSRKFATNFHDKVSVLQDISIYTEAGDLHLSEVFKTLKAKGNTPEPKADLKVVRKYLIDTIQLDSERVYDSDIKKLMNWYHLLQDKLDFSKLSKEIVEAETETEAKETAPIDQTEETPKKKTAVKKAAAPKKEKEASTEATPKKNAKKKAE